MMNFKLNFSKLIWFFPWLLVVVIIVAAIFWSGFFVAQNSSALVNNRILQLEASLSVKENYIVDLQRELAQTKVGNKLDQQLVKEIQTQLAALELALSDQKDEISYYREYINPNNSSKDVKIRSFDLYAENIFKESDEDSQANFKKYFYKLVLQSGNVEVEEEIVGVSLILEVEDQQSNEIKKLELGQVKKEVRFKYFKVIREEINIASHQTPKTVVVSLLLADGKNLIKRYKWDILN